MARQTGEPPAPEPVPQPGLVDSTHLSPGPADPPPVPAMPLEVERLPGPTEASEEPAPPSEPDDRGLIDPRFLMPGP